MATQPKNYLNDIHAMTNNQVNQAAINVLDQLLQRCTLNLVSDLTGISRTTLYKWLDEELPLDDMNHRDAAWLILMAETSPKMKMLLQRGPLSNPRLARRMLEGERPSEAAMRLSAGIAKGKKP